MLWHRPESAREYLKPELQGMGYDSGPEAEALVRAWQTGRTGFPIVDAGMRQLLGEAYVHNRVRMIVASFLVKDLHQEWTRGARYFLHHLVDGDLASNNHGWQWVAGTGTDASPYYRVFNPITQGKKFDPDGTYVKRWVRELRDVDPRYVHEPWTAPGGVPELCFAQVIMREPEVVEGGTVKQLAGALGEWCLESMRGERVARVEQRRIVHRARREQRERERDLPHDQRVPHATSPGAVADGPAAFLQHGIPGIEATAVDWGDRTPLDGGIAVHAEPTQHWSARGARDRPQLAARHALFDPKLSHSFAPP